MTVWLRVVENENFLTLLVKQLLIIERKNNIDSTQH